VRKYYLAVVVPDADHVVPAVAVRVSVQNLDEATVLENANDTWRLAGRLTSGTRDDQHECHVATSALKEAIAVPLAGLFIYSIS
jgi:hypothetical protein